MLQNKRGFYCIWQDAHFQYPVFSCLEELSCLNQHHLIPFFIPVHLSVRFTEELCKAPVPDRCPELFFLVQALKEVNVSTIKRWLKQACYLA